MQAEGTLDLILKAGLSRNADAKLPSWAEDWNPPESGYMRFESVISRACTFDTQAGEANHTLDGTGAKT